MGPVADARDLALVVEADEARFGGKAVALGRLIASGARVPPGFALEATRDPPDRWPAETRAELLARAAPLLACGPVAVRSSAPGEDSAERSFAGVFDTVLGVTSGEALLDAVGRCVASGQGDRARAYAGPAGRPVGVIVQSQVHARSAGVCFTVDPAGTD